MEVSIFPFKHKYLKDLIELHRSQNYADLSSINMKTLPKIGYIAYLGGQPIAAGFLRRLEPCYAQIDTLVSSAHFGSATRHQGVSYIVDALITDAKRLKLKGIIAHTSDIGTLERAKSLGFHIIPQTVIGLPLLP